MIKIGIVGANELSKRHISQLIQIPDFEITHDDLVIFSAHLIPGNEKSIDSIMTQLIRIGAKVVTGKEEMVHVSGHAFQEDQKLCI